MLRGGYRVFDGSHKMLRARICSITLLCSKWVPPISVTRSCIGIWYVSHKSVIWTKANGILSYDRSRWMFYLILKKWVLRVPSYKLSFFGKMPMFLVWLIIPSTLVWKVSCVCTFLTTVRIFKIWIVQWIINTTCLARY